MRLNFLLFEICVRAMIGSIVKDGNALCNART